MTAEVVSPRPNTVTVEDPEPSHLEGAYAGAVSRFVAYVIDVFAVGSSYALGAAALEYALATLGHDLNLDDAPIVSGIIFGLWSFVYFAYPLAVSGRTLGKAIIGVHVVGIHGQDIGAVRASARVLAMSLSFALLAVGLALIVVRKDRRALHDLIAGTTVVYAWQARSPRRRMMLRRPTPTRKADAAGAERGHLATRSK